MPKIKYPLIVSDFDGTLVCDNGEITTENKQAITKFVQDGGAFAISTGRMPSGILPRAKELGLKGLVSCCQGAIIMDIESGNTVFEHAIPNATAIQICEKMEEYNLHIHVYDLHDYYSNMDDDALKLYERAVRVKARLIKGESMSEFLKRTGMNVYKVLAMVDPKDNERVYRAIDSVGFAGCTTTKSAAYLVEVISKDYSKGTAVEFLANYYQVPIEQTVAVGDQWNDLPMVERAGVGIAVKNADDKLKEKATVCAFTNEESAIAHIINEYGYERE